MKSFAQFLSAHSGAGRQGRSQKRPIRRLLLAMLVAAALIGTAHAAAPDLNLEAYHGKVVYIDFWASWCSPCRQSFPWMKAMYQKYHDDGLVILAISVDKNRKAAKRFLDKYSPAFKVIFDPTGTLASKFHVKAMPSSYLLGRNGKPRFKHLGFHMDMRAEYEQQIRKLLAENVEKSP